MIILYLFIIVFFSFLLVRATDILVVNLKSLAKQTRLREFALTSLILAMGTSLPELFVGLVAGLEGRPNLSLGNILGANIANISLVIGGAALIGGIVNVRGDFLHRDVFYAFLAGSMPMLLLLDHRLSRTDGLILIFVYFFYNFLIFSESQKKQVRVHDEDFVRKLIRRLGHKGTKKELGWIFFGIALLLLSADVIVRVAEGVAVSFEIPLILIGIFLVSAGTTLPELILELKAIRERDPEMVFGNLLGSIVGNSTFIIGLVSLIAPIAIEGLAEYLVATMAFVIIFGLFYIFIRTKRRLERWEGATLVVIYLTFALIEFLR